MAVNYFGHNNPDGSCFGRDSADVLAFYGETPIAQRSSANQAAVVSTAITPLLTTVATSTTPYGFATQAQGDAIATAVNAIVTRQELIRVLVNELRLSLVPTTGIGMIKGS